MARRWICTGFGATGKHFLPCSDFDIDEINFCDLLALLLDPQQKSPNSKLFKMFSVHQQVVTGTQLEVQRVETMGAPSGTFFLGFAEGGFFPFTYRT